MTKIATIIAYRNTPDMVESQIIQIEKMLERVDAENDFVIVNMGVEKHYFDTIHIYEKEFKGKLYGHWIGLKSIKDKDKYDYYWFNHPDISFAVDMNCLPKLVRVMREVNRIGLLSPVQNPPHWFPDMYRKNRIWHPVGVCNYLSYFIRKDVIKKVGFMSPEFKYVRGAPIEYCYKIWKAGWMVAYCDIAKIFHFGGTTYGGKDTPSREEYLRKAVEFARKYFEDKYGKDWDKEFAKVLPDDAWRGIYTFHKRGWENWKLARILRKPFRRGILARVIGGIIWQ